jgi:nucleotide-binding universal stress UspA family protein
MGYKKILVTVDGSKISELAVQHAVRVADSGAQIHILSVIAEDTISEVAALASTLAYTSPVNAQWPPTPADNERDPHEIDARKKYVERLVEWLAPAGYDVIADVREGKVVETILQVAQNPFDLIVMVTHGRTGMAKVVLGSVAEAVLHQSHCPVLIIPARGE